MTKDELKSGIADMHGKLADLEAEARKLQNQNLADIVASAKNKLQQLGDHPDLEHVASAEQHEELPMFTSPTLGTEFPAQPPFVTGVAQPTGDDEKKTFHPGDPQFTERANVDFRDPHNVDLNKDGTLQVAPNAKGASDVRDQ